MQKGEGTSLAKCRIISITVIHKPRFRRPCLSVSVFSIHRPGVLCMRVMSLAKMLHGICPSLYTSSPALVGDYDCFSSSFSLG